MHEREEFRRVHVARTSGQINSTKGRIAGGSPTENYPFTLGDLGPRLWFLGPTRVYSPKRHFDQSVVFVGLTVVSNVQTNTQ